MFAYLQRRALIDELRPRVRVWSLWVRNAWFFPWISIGMPL